MTEKISRRTVARGMAWTIPVVVTVAAAPAYGTVSPGPVYIDYISESCKFPGQSVPGKEYGYKMLIVWTNNEDFAVEVTINQFDISGKVTTDVSPKVFTLTPGQNFVEFVVFSSNSAQREGYISYTALGQTTNQRVDFPAFPPCKD